MDKKEAAKRTEKKKTAARDCIPENGDPFYSRQNQDRLRKGIEQLEAGQGKVHELIEDDES